MTKLWLPLRRTGLGVLIGLALAILCALLFGWLSQEILESDTTQLDNHIRALIHGESETQFTRAMKIASDIGSPVVVGMLTLSAIVYFWIANRRQDAAIFAVTIVGAGVLSYVLKISFHRARPVPYFGIAVPNSFGFPSGHALVSLCFYGVLAYQVNSRIRNLAYRAGIWSVAVFMVVLIGFSRIYLGVHYPTDIAAGYAAGAVWVAAIVLAENSIRRRNVITPHI